MNIIVITIVIIVVILAIYIMQNKNVENYCAIQYDLCDNVCQKAKLDLCVVYDRLNKKMPHHCKYNYL